LERLLLFILLQKRKEIAINSGFCSRRFSSWVHLSTTLKKLPSLWNIRCVRNTGRAVLIH